MRGLTAWVGRFREIYLSDRFIQVIVGIGLLTRASDYLHNRSLWLDEAKIATNITLRSFGELLLPLDYEQGAPVGWLYLQKLMTLFFGPSELTLRFIPFISACVALALMPAVARRFLPRAAVPLAIAMFAFATQGVSYSIEIKQYATDLLFMVLLMWAIPDPAATSVDRRRIGWTAAIGATAIICSHPAVFMLAGLLGTLLATDWIARRRRRLIVHGTMAAALGGIFMLNFFLFLQQLSGNAHLKEYWADDFMPPPWRPAACAGWLWNELVDWFQEKPFAFEEFAIPAALLWGLGMVATHRRQRSHCWLLTTPFLFALAASAMRQYPFDGRFLLYCMAPFILLMAAGMHWLARALPANLIGVPVALAALLLYHDLIFSADVLLHGRKREELREVLRRLKAEIRPGEGILLGKSVAISWRYYTHHFPERYDFTGHALLEYDGADGDEVKTLRREMDARPLPERIWVVLTHYESRELRELQEKLKAVGDRQDKIAEQKACALLYAIDAGKLREAR